MNALASDKGNAIDCNEHMGIRRLTIPSSVAITNRDGAAEAIPSAEVARSIMLGGSSAFPPRHGRSPARGRWPRPAPSGRCCRRPPRRARPAARPPPISHQSVWPVNGRPRGAPVAPSHTRTVRSLLPETTTARPSELPDRHRSQPGGVAGERAPPRGAGGCVPYPHRPVAAAGDHHGAPVQLPDRHRSHAPGVAGERVSQQGAGGCVPYPQRPVAAAETTTVRPPSCPTATAYTLSVWPVNGSPTGAPVARPYPHRLVAAAGDHHGAPPQPPDRHRVHPAGVAGERVAQQGAGGRVPYPHRPVAAAGGTTTPRPSSCPTATDLTSLAWPVNGSPRGAPVAAFHTRTVWSSLPETTTPRLSTARLPPRTPYRRGR